MRIIEIFGQTPETEQFDPAIFIVANNGESIYSESASFGFMERHDTNIKTLNEHIEQMKREGFTINTRIIGLS